jgi:endonuclease YncB( thermonuclease family)
MRSPVIVTWSAAVVLFVWFSVSGVVAAAESVTLRGGARGDFHDCDTLTGLDDSQTQYKIRLDAIDAPELGQPFGQTSKKALSEKVFGKDVVVIAKTRDKYGRTVGHVLIDGRDVNLEMLEEGMAWHYEKYDHNKRMREAEQSARAARKGLWVDGSSVPPWEWRKMKE